MTLVWWMKILRRIYGVTRRDRVRNEEIRGALKCSDIVDMIEYRRRKYLGHVYRYPDEDS